MAWRTEKPTKGGDQLSEEFIILGVKGYIVLFEILIESLGTQNLGDLHQLVVVIVPVEEWLFTEDLPTNKVSPGTEDITGGTHHRGEHASITPHVQAIVVLLEVHKKFRALEVARCYPHIVFRLRVVKLG